MPARRPLLERLLDGTTAEPSGCIVWTGAQNSRGYGYIDEIADHLGSKTSAWRLVRS